MKKPQRNRKPGNLPVLTESAINDARSWWASVVSNPLFATILHVADGRSRIHVGIKETDHAQHFASGHCQGIDKLSSELVRLAEPDEPEDTGDDGFAE